MNRRICDYCGEPWPKHQIKLTNRPNDKSVVAELCDQCLSDIKVYLGENI